MDNNENIYVPDDGDIWAGTDPNVVFEMRDQAWEIATGSPMSIWAASYTGNVNRINKHLEAGVDINSLADGQSPLHFASEGGAIDSVELLISEKANENLKDHNGDTPLHISMRKGHLIVSEKLIKSGANPKIKNNLGILPGEDFVEPTITKKRTKADWVHKASELGDLTKITEFVDEDISWYIIYFGHWCQTCKSSYKSMSYYFAVRVFTKVACYSNCLERSSPKSYS